MFDTQSSGGRLSPLQIPDPLLRAELYREIRNAQTDRKYRNGGAWGYYTIQPADVLMPELIAHKAYALDTLKWVVMIAAGQDNPRDRLTAGKDIYLPSLAWLRERIRYYANLGART